MKVIIFVVLKVIIFVVINFFDNKSYHFCCQSYHISCGLLSFLLSELSFSLLRSGCVRRCFEQDKPPFTVGSPSSHQQKAARHIVVITYYYIDFTVTYCVLYYECVIFLFHITVKSNVGIIHSSINHPTKQQNNKKKSSHPNKINTTTRFYSSFDKD